MSAGEMYRDRNGWPKLALLPIPAKALVTMIILTMAVALVGALGQIVVHDIIPTFFAEEGVAAKSAGEVVASPQPETGEGSIGRGDLFDMEPSETKGAKPFYEKDPEVEPHSPFRYEHDLHFRGSNNRVLGSEHQGPDLAHRAALFRCVHRYLWGLAKRLHFSFLFLAAPSWRHAFWDNFSFRFFACSLGDVVSKTWKLVSLDSLYSPYCKKYGQKVSILPSSPSITHY